MKAYRNYSGGDVPELEVLREGKITRINFDFSVEERTDEGETTQQLVFENVDIEGAVEYGKIVSAIVRDKYSQDKVEAVLANGEDTPEHKTELKDFKDWRKTAKQVAADVVVELESE